MTKTIHPFPARMAPEVALEKLSQLTDTGIVLDPMAGSGMVLRQATSLGHHAIGFDTDPLAVLMSRVWTTYIHDNAVLELAKRLLDRVDAIPDDEVRLPWMDDDTETTAFVNFWFAESQKLTLRRIAFILNQFSYQLTSVEEHLALDVLRIALSRIIITKDKGASLARDISHSRPHRVVQTSNFQVRPMFERSIVALRKRLSEAPAPGGASVDIGDARSLTCLAEGSVDAVVTSPPYLNAIDYMRGHRLSLVWLGYNIKTLRAIRSHNIGSERSPDQPSFTLEHEAIRLAIGKTDELPRKFSRMIDRYVQDISQMTSEIGRVLKSGGQATLVVGNSCLRGVFIRNATAVAEAASVAGLILTSESERTLPTQSRYLPLTSEALGKRMRTETILSFVRA